MTDQTAIELLKIEDADVKKALTHIFTTYRNGFVWWAMKKYACTEDEGITLFEDAIIKLLEIVKKKEDFILTSSLKTYLIGIAINLKREEARHIST